MATERVRERKKKAIHQIKELKTKTKKGRKKIKTKEVELNF